MKTYELTLKGFDAGTDQTDHLVKWVQAENRAMLDAWIEQTGIGDLIAEVNEMEKYTWNYTMDDGVDVVVFADGVYRSSADLATWRDEVIFDVEVGEDEPIPVLELVLAEDHSPKQTIPSWLVPVVCGFILFAFYVFFMWMGQ